MKVIEGQTGRIGEPTAATIGMFDGVHAGHRCMLEFLEREAQKRGVRTVVVTFSRHPQCVLHPERPFPMLMALDDKLEAISSTGIDFAVLLDFDRELSQMSAYGFIRLIRDCYNVRLLLVGYDHRFGHGRAESFSDYLRYGKELGVEIVQAPELDSSLGHVSSSAIRKLILEGNVRLAAGMLSCPFKLKGRVVDGFKNGRKLGFPTANLCLDGSLVVPARGVYAVRVVFPDGIVFGGMLNIGVRPTFNGTDAISAEVHIFGFSGDIYGQALSVELLERMRDERRMASLEELKRQLEADKAQAQEILNSYTI